MNLTLQEIASVLHCENILEECANTDARQKPRLAQIDSRLVEQGDIFVCIPGEHVDGHDYAHQAAKKGAVAIFAEKPLEGIEIPIFVVENSVAALGAVAAFYRGKTNAKVVGITGTAGKTTVKEMLAHILAQKGTTAKNEKNLNNQIGLPLSILAADGDEKFWVFEAGISQTWDMDELGAILQPDLALIINVGPAHLEGLGSIQNVAACKSALLKYLTAQGEGVISLDYPELVDEAFNVRPGCVGFSSKGRNARYQGHYVGPESGGSGRYQLWMKGEVFEVSLKYRGELFAENAIAAAAVARLLGLSNELIATGLESFEIPEKRFQLKTVGELLIIDDSYNANPLSMNAALKCAAEQAGNKPLLLVLGEMLELGAIEQEAHEELGRAAARTNPYAVFWRGGHGVDLARGLRTGGYTGRWEQVDTVELFLEEFKEMGMESGVVLFKGSRGSRMDEFSGALLKELSE